MLCSQGSTDSTVVPPLHLHGTGGLHDSTASPQGSLSTVRSREGGCGTPAGGCATPPSAFATPTRHLPRCGVYNGASPDNPSGHCDNRGSIPSDTSSPVAHHSPGRHRQSSASRTIPRLSPCMRSGAHRSFHDLRDAGIALAPEVVEGPQQALLQPSLASSVPHVVAPTSSRRQSSSPGPSVAQAVSCVVRSLLCGAEHAYQRIEPLDEADMDSVPESPVAPHASKSRRRSTCHVSSAKEGSLHASPRASPFKAMFEKVVSPLLRKHRPIQHADDVLEGACSREPRFSPERDPLPCVAQEATLVDPQDVVAAGAPSTAAPLTRLRSRAIACLMVLASTA